MSFSRGLAAGVAAGQAFRQNLDRRRSQRQMAELGEQFAPQQVQGSIIQYSPLEGFEGTPEVPVARPVIGDDLDWEQYTQEAARRGLVPERQDATFYQVPFSEGLYSSQAQAMQRYAPDRMIAESHLLRQMGYHDEARALFDQAQTMRGDPTAQVAQRLELIDTQLSSLDTARTRGHAMMAELRQAAGDNLAARALGITQEDAVERLNILMNRDIVWEEQVAELIRLQHNLSHPPSAQIDRNDVLSAMEILTRDGISATPENIRQLLDDIAFGPVDPEADPGAPPAEPETPFTPDDADGPLEETAFRPRPPRRQETESPDDFEDRRQQYERVVNETYQNLQYLVNAINLDRRSDRDLVSLGFRDREQAKEVISILSSPATREYLLARPDLLPALDIPTSLPGARQGFGSAYSRFYPDSLENVPIPKLIQLAAAVAAEMSDREPPRFAQGGLVQNPNAPEPMAGMSSRRRRSLMDRARERFGDEYGQPRGLDRESVRAPALYSPEPSPEVLIQAARERRHVQPGRPEPEFPIHRAAQERRPLQGELTHYRGLTHQPPPSAEDTIRRVFPYGREAMADDQYSLPWGADLAGRDPAPAPAPGRPPVEYADDQYSLPHSPAREIAWDQLGRLHDTPVDPGTATHRAAQERRALVGRPPVEYADDQYSLPPGAELAGRDPAPAPAPAPRRPPIEYADDQYSLPPGADLPPVGETAVDRVVATLRAREGVGSDVEGDVSTGPLGLTQGAVDRVAETGAVPNLEVGADLEDWAEKYRSGDEDAVAMAEQAARVYAQITLDDLTRDAYPNLDLAPLALQEVLVDSSYNLGSGALNRYTELPAAVEAGDWQEAARQLLNTARQGGKTMWGLARRRAENYNTVAQEVGFPPIARVEVRDTGEIEYFDADGNSIMAFGEESGLHSQSRRSIGVHVLDPATGRWTHQAAGMAQGGLVRNAVPHMARGGYMADRRAAVASMHSRPPITAPGRSMRERLADAGQALSESMGGISSEAPHVMSHREPGSHGLLRERPRLTPDPRLPYAQYAGGGYVKDRARELGTRVHDYRGGGKVRGPGTETSDSIPAMLSDGEYVINAKAVREVGKDTLDRINARGLTR